MRFRLMLYATFLGGENNDIPYNVAIGPDRLLFLSGSTGSSAFPTTPYAFDPDHNGQSDGFLMGHFAMLGLLQAEPVEADPEHPVLRAARNPCPLGERGGEPHARERYVETRRH